MAYTPGLAGLFEDRAKFYHLIFRDEGYILHAMKMRELFTMDTDTFKNVP